MSERSDKPGRPKSPGATPGWWILLRDTVTFIGGWVLIFMEVQRPEVRESVMVFGGVIIGVPGLAVGATTLAEALHRRGTDVQPPQPAELPSSPSS